MADASAAPDKAGDITGQASPTGMADASADPDKAGDITGQANPTGMADADNCIQGGGDNCIQRQNDDKWKQHPKILSGTLYRTGSQLNPGSW